MWFWSLVLGDAGLRDSLLLVPAAGAGPTWGRGDLLPSQRQENSHLTNINQTHFGLADILSWKLV